MSQRTEGGRSTQPSLHSRPRAGHRPVLHPAAPCSIHTCSAAPRPTWPCCSSSSTRGGASRAISRVKKLKAWPSVASRPVRPTLENARGRGTIGKVGGRQLRTLFVLFPEREIASATGVNHVAGGFFLLLKRGGMLAQQTAWPRPRGQAAPKPAPLTVAGSWYDKRAAAACRKRAPHCFPHHLATPPMARGRDGGWDAAFPHWWAQAAQQSGAVPDSNGSQQGT